MAVGSLCVAVVSPGSTARAILNSAGAAELHAHPRAADGRESLAAVDDTLRLVRHACPGTLVGVSTGAWIESDKTRTLDCIASWRVVPDYASVNLSEEDAPVLIGLLRARGDIARDNAQMVTDAVRMMR